MNRCRHCHAWLANRDEQQMGQCVPCWTHALSAEALAAHWRSAWAGCKQGGRNLTQAELWHLSWFAKLG